MSGRRERPIDPFVKFLMDEATPPLKKPIELAVKTGKSPQLIKKYADNGLDDMGKRLELVDLCEIPRDRLKMYISKEIDERHLTG